MKQNSSLIKSSLPPPDLPVPANEKLLAWVGDEILPRESAKVPIYWWTLRSATQRIDLLIYV